MKLTRYPETYNPILEYWDAIQSGRETVSLKVQKTYRHVVEQLENTDSEFYYSPRRANHVLEFLRTTATTPKARRAASSSGWSYGKKHCWRLSSGLSTSRATASTVKPSSLSARKTENRCWPPASACIYSWRMAKRGRRSMPLPPSETRRRSSGRKQRGWSRSPRRSAAGCAAWSLSWTAILTTAFSSRWPLTVTPSTASTSTGP